MTKAEKAYRRSKKKKLGTGARFEAFTDVLKERGAENPRALAAYIGRRKYGSKKMAKWAAKGRK